MITFDLDGVLANTLPLVRTAYAQVGVTMPEDAWGKPWKEWLPRAVGCRPGSQDLDRVHATKNIIYKNLLASSSPKDIGLPALTVLRDISNLDHAVGIVTSASKEAAEAVLDTLGLSRSLLLHTGVKDKVPVLISLEARVHLDDSTEVISQLSSRSDVRGILVYPNMREEDIWIALFSQLDAMNA